MPNVVVPSSSPDVTAASVYQQRYWEVAEIGEYAVHILDGGAYGGGFTLDLPSHGRCWFEFAVWYRGQH